jgi:sarcosine oxidase, subunit alpha
VNVMPTPEAVEYDLVVVGGGPAGLAAARIVAEAGGRVVIIDENHELGGKLRGQLHEEVGGHWWKGYKQAELAQRAASDAGAQLMTDAVVWALEPGWTVRLSRPTDRHARPRALKGKSVLVATGAVERAMPVEGWTLPGVMTIGAAQVMTNIHRVKPGRRVLVVGFDVLSLTIARAMKLAGVEVVGIVLPPMSEAGNSTYDTLARLAPTSRLAPTAYMRWGGRLLDNRHARRVLAWLMPQTLRIWGIPMHLRTSLVAIRGDDVVRHAVLTRTRPDGTPISGAERTVEVDAVCLANGLSPLHELLGPLGGSFFTTPDLGGTVPLHSDDMRTEHPGLYVAGNTVGVEGAKIATLQGELAGTRVIADLGLHTVSQEAMSAAVAGLAAARHDMEVQFNRNTQRGHDDVQRAWEARE